MNAVQKLQRALEDIVDNDYDTWGGVHESVRNAVAAHNELHPEYPVVIPDDAD